jgi:hypothetical protein
MRIRSRDGIAASLGEYTFVSTSNDFLLRRGGVISGGGQDVKLFEFERE